MEESYHIFENLVKDENTFTQLTYNLLKFKSFRDIFIEFIIANYLIADSIEFNDFDTQYSIGKNGRPDLAIVNSEIEILIEIKIYDTKRTKNQPLNYLNHLNSKADKKKTAIIFIVPKDYYDEYACDLSYKDFDIKYPKNSILKRFVYWEDLKLLLDRKEIEQISPIFKEYNILLKQWFSYSNTIFTFKDLQIMFTSEIPTVLNKITDLVIEIKAELNKRGFNLKDRYGKFFEEHGFYLQNSKSENILFFGCWLDFWTDTSFPIVLNIESDGSSFDEAFIKICNEKNLNYMFYQTAEYNVHLIYFEKQLLQEKDHNKIVDIILNFKNLLK